MAALDAPWTAGYDCLSGGIDHIRLGMMADAYKPHVNGITHFIRLNKLALEAAGPHLGRVFGGFACANVEYPTWQ